MTLSARLFAASALLAAAAPLAPTAGGPQAPALPFPGWPAEYEGRPLTPLVMSAREQRFARGFPGRIQTFTDGRRTLILRFVDRPTRRLHPARDCFRGAGYHLQPRPTLARSDDRWGRFEAARGGETLLVSERIEGPGGESWTDVPSWYWAAWTGRSSGPWWAITVVARAEP